jgi:ADP-ribose pyrophosphatase YjhB (NUDIX family)
MPPEKYRPLRFNIRVYGICIAGGCVLVNEELIKGRHVIKFPGGGLELGEGPVDGLKREWMEELGVDIEVPGHYYTTDFFQQSAFNDTQVISIYYRVQLPAGATPMNLLPDERTYWMPLADLREDTFTLPIDAVVGKMLQQDFLQKRFPAVFKSK